MNKIFSFTLKQNFTTVWISLSILAVTLALTIILGSAVGNMQENGMGSKEKVLIYNDLEAPNKEYFNDLFEGDDFEKIIIVTFSKELIDAEELINKREYDTVVIASKIDGKETIHIKSVRDESFMFSIAAKYTNIVNTVTIIEEISVLTPQIEKQYQEEVINTVELNNGRPIGTDYYGVQTLLQMSTMLAIMGIFTVMDDRTKNIYPRIKTVPISRNKVVAGRLLACVLYMTTVQIAIAVISKVVFGINWSGNYLAIIITFFLFSLITMTLSMMIATLTKSTIGSIGIMIGIGSTLWPRYSGAFSPFTPIGYIGYASPNFHAVNAIFSSIYGGSIHVILESLLWLLAMAVLAIAAYAVVERRQNNDGI